MIGPSSRPVLNLIFAGVLGMVAVRVQAADEGPAIPADATLVPYDRGVFRPDPFYGEQSYNAEEQIEIYGGKHANPTARPLLELGRELYTEGPFRKAPAPVGKKNLIFAHLLAYGDWRTAIGYSDNGATEQSTIATRLNLDVDLKLTATERVHLFFRPFERDGNLTRWDFAGDNHDAVGIFESEPLAYFFEGDLSRIVAGFTDTDPRWDLPFAGGLMPLLFQNGVWVEDAFTGFAATIPARNSPLLDISNADVTFFAGFDKVTSGAIKQGGKFADHNAHLYGVTAFLETMQGYWELGYGFTDATEELGDLDYHNLTAAFTRRYRGRLSNTVRVIWNFGQDASPQTADGFIVLIENSFITDKPSTLIPYLNLFAGFDHPQSLARDAGAGGILKNTGLSFETDGLTGFPKLDDTAQNTYGGALGIEYLFNFDQQIVLETAVLKVRNDKDTVAAGDQFGIGIRYQKPLSNAWILRADAMAAWRDNAHDLAGVRIELRRKF